MRKAPGHGVAGVATRNGHNVVEDGSADGRDVLRGNANQGNGSMQELVRCAAGRNAKCYPPVHYAFVGVRVWIHKRVARVNRQAKRRYGNQRRRVHNGGDGRPRRCEARK